MSRLLSLLIACGVLAACNMTAQRRTDTYDKIGQELEAASKNSRAALDQAMLPPLPMETPVVPKSEPRFNLAVNNAPVTQVLTALARDTPYNVIFAPDVDGLVSLTMKNTTVFEVLDTLRDIYGYDFKISGKRIHVYPKTIQARFFKVNYLAGRRQGASETRVTGSSPTTSSGNTGASGQQAASSQASGQGGSVRRDGVQVQTRTDNEEFWNDLKNAITAIFSAPEGRSVVINPVSGVVLVKATPPELRAVENYLSATQLAVERQVMLEAKIVEVELNDSFQTGINWAKFGGIANRFAFGVMAPGSYIANTGQLVGQSVGISNGNTSTQLVVTPSMYGPASMQTDSKGQGMFGMAYSSNDFSALLSFLEGQGNVQVLSSPRIATTNNQKAVLKVGTDDYFITGITGGSSVSSAAGATSGVTETSPTISLNPFFSGIALDVTPQIDDAGGIVLHIHPSVSNVQEKTKQFKLNGKDYEMPLASSTINESDTVVRVVDGSIVAIGGLMKQVQDNSSNGLPVVSGLPGLGLLFGQKSSYSSKRELVILLRSTVIKDEKSWRDLAAETQERVQAYDPRQLRNIELK